MARPRSLSSVLAEIEAAEKAIEKGKQAAEALPGLIEVRNELTQPEQIASARESLAASMERLQKQMEQLAELESANDENADAESTEVEDTVPDTVED